MKGARYLFISGNGLVAEVAAAALNDAQSKRFQRTLAQRLGTPIGKRLATAAEKNPTLVHHGKAGAASYHVVWKANGAALADLYTPSPVYARRITQAMSDILDARLLLLDNLRELPTLPEHPIALQATPRKRNPSNRPVAGESWTSLAGQRVKVLSVSGSRVQVLVSDTGNREWVGLADFMASYRLKGARARNPGKRTLSVPDQHRLKIARDTLKMNDAVARIMGGMTKDEARAVILELTGKPASNPKRNSGSRRFANLRDVAEQFGWNNWHQLTMQEAEAVLRDVAEIADDDGESDGYGDDIRAARILRKRIGGESALKSYAQVLVAGERRRSRNPKGKGRAKRNPGRDYHRKAPVVGAYLQRNSHPQHIARVTGVERASGGMPPMVSLDIVTGRGQVMGSTRLPVNVVLDEYAPLPAGSPYRSTLPNPKRPSKARARRNPPRIVVGDRVRYSASWLRSTGTYTGALPQARGVVVSILPKFGKEGLATIQWDRAGVPDKVLIANLVKVGAIEHNKRRRRARSKRTKRAKRNPSSERERAERTFNMWHEFDSSTTVRMKGPDRKIPSTLVKLGDLVSVVYKSNKYTGKPTLYEHKTKRPHPVLAADPDGRHVFIVGGRMRITGDGLVN